MELWEYAFNTGDTEEFNKIRQDGDFCVRFADEVKSLRENSVIIQPLEDTIIPDNIRSYDCYRKDTGIFGVCIELSQYPKNRQLFEAAILRTLPVSTQPFAPKKRWDTKGK